MNREGEITLLSDEQGDELLRLNDFGGRRYAGKGANERHIKASGWGCEHDLALKPTPAYSY